MDNTNTYIGIDVSKKHLDVHILPANAKKRFMNTPAGINKLKEFIGNPVRIVLEPTGGYERNVLYALAEAGFCVCKVNAANIRFFALSFGQLAKTDAIDAMILAEFARQREPRSFVLPTKEEHRLRRLNVRRSQLIRMMASEKNRIDRCLDKEELGFITKVLAYMQKQKDKIEDLMLLIVGNNQDMSAKLQVLASLHGIGTMSAIALMVEMPELGKIGKNQISKLAGVAPFNKDSGETEGKARTYAGRREVCRIMYFCALSTLKPNSPFNDFFNRLKARGKSGRLAVVAVIHKMLIILNARMRDYYETGTILTR